MTVKKTCIGIIGRISSGKSTVAKAVNNRFQIPILSFGTFLFEYSKSHGLPIERQDLQNLGTHFIKTDPIGFLHQVINDSSSVGSDVYIIEGIRHNVIFDGIREIFDKSFFVFCDTPANIRLERYLQRDKEVELHKDLSSFRAADAHDVESEIEVLKERCDYLLTDQAENFEDLFFRIEQILQ